MTCLIPFEKSEAHNLEINNYDFDYQVEIMLWYCWLDTGKSIWPVRNWVMTDEVLAWLLSVWSEVQIIYGMVQLMPLSLYHLIKMVYLCDSSICRLFSKRGHWYYVNVKSMQWESCRHYIDDCLSLNWFAY